MLLDWGRGYSCCREALWQFLFCRASIPLPLARCLLSLSTTSAQPSPHPPPQVLAQKQNMLNILSRTTGHSPEKLDKARRGAGGRGAFAVGGAGCSAGAEA